jgi:hypothetical protein
MALSTNSIIHYTRTIDSLKAILKEGFKVQYCYEKVLSSEKGYMHAAFPIVSFCDIPLSQVKDHIDSYGDYGIGLKKDWAKMKKLNPVLYFDQDSELINYIREEFERLNNKTKAKEIPFKDIDHFIKILAFSKNYEANLTRKGSTIKDYRFYNEREWRYVPNLVTLDKAKPWVEEKDYITDIVKYNNTLNHIRLAFDSIHITYIIVKNENDIKELTQTIRNLFSEKCTLQEMEILLTRIITTDQIRYDF